MGLGNSRRGQAPLCPGDRRKPPVSSPQGPGTVRRALCRSSPLRPREHRGRMRGARRGTTTGLFCLREDPGCPPGWSPQESRGLLFMCPPALSQMPLGSEGQSSQFSGDGTAAPAVSSSCTSQPLLHDQRPTLRGLPVVQVWDLL